MKAHKIFSPNACQKLIFISPKIIGISQFQSHIKGKAKIKQASSADVRFMRKPLVASFVFSIALSVCLFCKVTDFR